MCGRGRGQCEQAVGPQGLVEALQQGAVKGLRHRTLHPIYKAIHTSACALAYLEKTSAKITLVSTSQSLLILI